MEYNVNISGVPILQFKTPNTEQTDNTEQCVPK